MLILFQPLKIHILPTTLLQGSKGEAESLLQPPHKIVDVLLARFALFLIDVLSATRSTGTAQYLPTGLVNNSRLRKHFQNFSSKSWKCLDATLSS